MFIINAVITRILYKIESIFRIFNNFNGNMFYIARRSVFPSIDSKHEQNSDKIIFLNHFKKISIKLFVTNSSHLKYIHITY